MRRIIDIATLPALLLLLGLDIVASISCFLERRWTNGFQYVGACGFLGLILCGIGDEESNAIKRQSIALRPILHLGTPETIPTCIPQAVTLVTAMFSALCEKTK